MSQDTRSDEGTTTTGWTHCCDQNGVDNIAEWLLFVFVLIPSSLVQELPDQLDWRLSPVLFFRRHVQIIHKQDAPTSLGSVESLSLPVHLSVDDILRLD